ncbi:lipopolysaccharide biosynthesis protein [Krasilnikovia cinnamomea]|uniref:lipopolysaccharide biosynthesis protein n=1 Tax=Krasilnikovia cinnamomea TaxID=349313 RepID=UPI00102BF108|nr:hypothetical protein [Krasilnikovia cinnamomea]
MSRSFLIATVSGQGALAFLSVIFLAAGIGAPTVWLIAYGLCLLVPFLVAGRPDRDAAPNSLGETRRVGLRLSLSMVAGMVMLRSDRLLLPALAGYGQLGIYGTIATITEMISLPVQAYVDSHVPAWRRAHDAGKLNRWRPLAAVVAFSLSTAAAVTLVVRALVVPALGEQYRSAIPLVLPLAIAAALYAVSRAGVGLAVASGKTRAVVAVDMTAMTTSVAGYLILIPDHGAAGAAIGSIVGYGIAALIATAVALAASRTDGGGS